VDATERKQKFIRQLAEYLAGTNQCRYSILLSQRGQLKECADDWAALRGLTPLFGYPSVEEAEKILTDFLR